MIKIDISSEEKGEKEFAKVEEEEPGSYYQVCIVTHSVKNQSAIFSSFINSSFFCFSIPLIMYFLSILSLSNFTRNREVFNNLCLS